MTHTVTWIIVRLHVEEIRIVTGQVIAERIIDKAVMIIVARISRNLIGVYPESTLKLRMRQVSAGIYDCHHHRGRLIGRLLVGGVKVDIRTGYPRLHDQAVVVRSRMAFDAPVDLPGVSQPPLFREE